jgi:agmatinase
MSHIRTSPPPDGKTFLGLPLCSDVESLQAKFAILGVPIGCPYPTELIPNDQSHAPDAIRRASARLSLGLDRWDFDIDGEIGDLSAVDCGDVAGNMQDYRLYAQHATETVQAILERSAIPLVLGGDHSITIPVLRAYAGYGPLTLVQVDAHLDWRDEVHGAREGYSSPMRRAAEMAHVKDIVQIGLRAQGSARQEDVQAAQAYGAQLITAYTVHEQSMPPILERIPDRGNYYLTIDADGLDPSVMPAVEGPAAGGLLFPQVRALIHGLKRKGKLVGMDIVELTPARDLNEISAITAGQLIVNFIGGGKKYLSTDGRG